MCASDTSQFPYICVNTAVLSLSLSLSLAALSVLRSSEEQAPVPQSKCMGDIEELAASYERKLIEVRAVSSHSLLLDTHE